MVSSGIFVVSNEFSMDFRFEICGGGGDPPPACPNFGFSQIESILGIFRITWIVAPKRLKNFARLRRANSRFTLEIPIYLKIYPNIFRAPSARRIFNDATNFSSDSRKVEWGFYFCLQILESEWGCYFCQISISEKLRGVLFLSKNLRKVRGGI